MYKRGLGRRTKNQTLREKVRRLSEINSDMQNIITEQERRLARYENPPDDNTKIPSHTPTYASNAPETPAPSDSTVPYGIKPDNIPKSAPTDYQSRTYDMSQIGKNAKSDRYSITSLMTKNRTYGSNKDAQTVLLVNLDGIIQDPKSLHAMTLMKPEQFDYLCAKFDDRVSQRNLDRLFWDDDLRASDPGTRSKLYIRHALLMSLLHKKEAIPEALLGVLFGIYQGTVSRYLKTVNSVLAEILPTARNLTSIIREIYKKRNNDAKPKPAEGKDKQGDDVVGQDAKPNHDTTAERAGPRSRTGTPAPVAATNNAPAPTVIGAPAGGEGLPGILAGPLLDNRTDGQLSTRVATITDGTHTPVERSKNSAWNKATYSGKKKTHTYNTNITIAPEGTTIHISKTVPGSVGDLTLYRESPPDLGAISDAAADPNTPKDERPINIYDRGYQGIQKDNPGAETWIGIKRNSGSDPETKGLTQQDRDHNTEVTRVRIIVEHVIGDIKEYALMRKRYMGTPEQYNDDLNIITGLVNLRRMWDSIKSKEDPDMISRLGSWRKR